MAIEDHLLDALPAPGGLRDIDPPPALSASIAWVAVVLAMALAGKLSVGAAIMAAWAIAALWLAVYGSGRADNAPPPEIRSGIEGEARVLAALRELPDSCALFNQLHIPNPRSRTGFTECDFVVVSPAGVYVVEVKNHRGLIEGGAEQAPQWTLVRDRGRESMRNPVRQAAIQARVARVYLRGRGVRAPVYPLVVLSNPLSAWQPGAAYSVPVVQLREQAPGDLIGLGQHSEQIGDEQWRQAIAALAALRFRTSPADRLVEPLPLRARRHHRKKPEAEPRALG